MSTSEVRGHPCFFGILFQCFVQRSSYLLCAFLPLLSFQHQLPSFNLTFMQVFERLLSPCSFECPKAPLVHQQVLFPISSGGIGLVFVEANANNIFGELSINCANHYFQIFVKFTPIPFGVSSSSTLEVVLKVFSPNYNSMYTLFKQFVEKGIY